MLTPARSLFLLGALSTANVCPSIPTPQPDTSFPTQTPTYTPTPSYTPTPEHLDFDPSEGASVICDERGWHITLDVTGWTEIEPEPVFGIYDIPNGEAEPIYQELHPIYYMDSYADPYYEVLYLDLAFATPDSPQAPGESSDFGCRREEVLSFQFCSFDYFYPQDGPSCWAFGFAPGSVPAPQGY